ncbi:PTS system mannose/fructose/N-acetylgalactosamine-transporter subunit IIB [Loigolactobacillus jiayinensis]|uniref:PTS system mannose/fructose/N-acetylgalactosamine-transporter subunit IIB n=1 Tax=Loigolactobacillus jiayinensis TaxID=2486016 RepID=A0ABW1RDU1_9LACO|nr:PTS sugar transporter subunit IIB [Loigolactobacillus jiayinensis]
MAIIHARIDERLIHGQVATVWTRLSGAERIVVVNDKAVKDDMQIGVLKMARPQGIKLTIMSVRRAIYTFSQGRYADEKIFLLTQNIQDMAALIAGGIKTEQVNVGNIAPHEGTKQIKASVYLNEQDIADVKLMIEQGVKVTAQMVPTESDALITTFIK